MRELILSVCVLVSSALAGPVSAQQPFEAVGVVEFSNLQGFLSGLEELPYRGKSSSTLSRNVLQSGSIRANGPPLPVPGQPNLLAFSGVIGNNPYFGKREIHPLIGRGGILFTTWTADFTIEIDIVTGLAIFTGDGQFTVVGGTGRYRNASGTFRTLFRSRPTPLTADSAIADFTQSGTVSF